LYTYWSMRLDVNVDVELKLAAPYLNLTLDEYMLET